jgi:multidrug resistance efflux pump
MEKEKINIELKSEILNEVLSTPPSWLVRSGNTLFFFFIVLLLVLSWMISYPDELTGEVNLHGNRPPIEYENQLYGKLVDLRVADQQEVQKGMILAQFDNEIDPRQIQNIAAFLLSLQNDTSVQTVLTPALENVNLGVLQESWKQLLSLLKERNELVNSGHFRQKIVDLQIERVQRKKLQTIALQKLALIEKEVGYQQVQTQSAKRLLARQAISREEYIKEEKTENHLQQLLQNQREALVQIEIQLNALSKLIHETKYNDDLLVKKMKFSIDISAASLQNSIAEWNKNTAWVAPFSGRILFNKQLTRSSFYKPGEASLVLVPAGNRFRALMKVPIQGSGKIEKGQKVFMEFSDFPKNEFGLLEGSVQSITSVSKNEWYEVEINLPKKLLTTYQKEIPVKAILKGNAKIITKNKRLIHRFFEKVINLMEK